MIDKKNSTHRRTWQKSEGRIAAQFGAKRNVGSGSMGRKDKTSSDSTHDRLYIECKLAARFAVVTLWDDAAKKAKKEKKTPVVCQAVKNRPGFWVTCHIDDLLTVAEEHAKELQAEIERDEERRSLLPGQSTFLEG